MMRAGRLERHNRAVEMYAKAMAEKPAATEAKPTGFERLAAWFGVTIKAHPFLVVPRVLAHQMPDDWQERFAACLEEYAAKFPKGDDTWRVRCASKTTGKLVDTPEHYLSYLKRDGLAKVAEMTDV